MFAALSFMSVGWQVIKNPFLILSSLSFDSPKTHERTWSEFGPTFMRAETSDLPGEFLAAIAQTESSGRQWTNTEWSLDLNRGVFNIVAPISTSFGLMQFTKETFERNKHLCVVDGRVETKKPWYMLDGCWFTPLKTRASAEHSVNIAGAYLQNEINAANAARRSPMSKDQAMKFAAVTHLCGKNVAKRLADKRFRIPRGQLCGTHSVKLYVKKIKTNYKKFRSLHEEALASR